MAAIRRTGRWVAAAALLTGVVVAMLVLLPSLLGWQRYAIVSGSMTGTYDRGSLVLDEVVPTADLRVGDVITYLPPRGSGPDHLITHRIAWIGRGDDGARVYRTKGDANTSADPWTFTLSRPTQARVRAGVPYVGFLLMALTRRDVRLWIIALPALLIALVTLASLWRSLGDAARAAESAA
jgi:signal peptidase I